MKFQVRQVAAFALTSVPISNIKTQTVQKDVSDGMDEYLTGTFTDLGELKQSFSK